VGRRPRGRAADLIREHRGSEQASSVHHQSRRLPRARIGRSSSSSCPGVRSLNSGPPSSGCAKDQPIRPVTPR